MKTLLGIIMLMLFTIAWVMIAPPGDASDEQVITLQDLESCFSFTELNAINKLTLRDVLDIDAPVVEQYLQPVENVKTLKASSIGPDVTERTGIGLRITAYNSDYPTNKPCRNGVRADTRYRTGIGV